VEDLPRREILAKSRHLNGDMTHYKMPDHNKLLVDGIRKVGLPE
jgi:hypothetical protein